MGESMNAMRTLNVTALKIDLNLKYHLNVGTNKMIELQKMERSVLIITRVHGNTYSVPIANNDIDDLIQKLNQCVLEDIPKEM